MIKYLLVAACLLATTADARVITKTEPVAPAKVTMGVVEAPQIQIPVIESPEDDVELTLQWTNNSLDVIFFLFTPGGTGVTHEFTDSMGSHTFSYPGPLDGTYYWYAFPNESGTSPTLALCTSTGDKLVIWNGTMPLSTEQPPTPPPFDGWQMFTWPPSN